MSALDAKITAQLFCQYVPYENSKDGDMTDENEFNVAVKRVPPRNYVIAYGYGRNGIDLPLISNLSFGEYDCTSYNMTFRYDTSGENSRMLSKFYNGNYFITVDYEEMIVRLRMIPKTFKSPPHASQILYDNIASDPYNHEVCKSVINNNNKNKKFIKLPIVDCELLHEQQMEIGQCIVFKHKNEKRFIQFLPKDNRLSGFKVFDIKKSSYDNLIFNIKGKRVYKI